MKTIIKKTAGNQIIHFKHIPDNILKNKKDNIEGIAKNLDIAMRSSETKVSNDKELYPIGEYIYENYCWLSIKTGIKTKPQSKYMLQIV